MSKIEDMTEFEMRDSKVPTFKTKKELMNYVSKLLNRNHDYGTCVYVVSMSTIAMYNYMASKLGITGFQAGCVDLDIIRRSKGWEMFGFENYENLLYPQYCNEEYFSTWLTSAKKYKEWLKEKAKENLKKGNKFAHSEVIRHWKWIVEEL